MIRTVVAINIASESFSCCFTNKFADGTTKIAATHRFNNTESGYMQLMEWVAKH